MWEEIQPTSVKPNEIVYFRSPDWVVQGLLNDPTMSGFQVRFFPFPQ